MDNSLKKRNLSRTRRFLRVRKKLRGTSEMPRMCVCKTNKHISVQIIDDEKKQTLFSFGTLSKEVKETEFNHKSKASARYIGKKIAEMAKGKNIEKVIFDRGRLCYHGLIAELANAARETGLQF